jgi:hypothetical protein
MTPAMTPAMTRAARESAAAAPSKQRATDRENEARG